LWWVVNAIAGLVSLLPAGVFSKAATLRSHPRCSQWQRPEQFNQAWIWLDIVGLTCVDERIQIGGGAANGIGKQPSLAADDKGADRIFTLIALSC
jgi:hypothetical protein